MGRPKGSKNRKAKESTGSDAGTSLDHNRGDRAARINSYFEERYQLERSIENALARHVQPIRDDKNTLNKEFRNDLGFNEADVRGDYINFKRKRDAELMDDEGQRDQVLTNMQELHEALYEEGGQLSWLAAFEKAQTPAEGTDAEQDVRPRFLQEQEAAGTA